MDALHRAQEKAEIRISNIHNELKENEKDKTDEYNVLNSKTPEKIWSEELDILEAKYIKWYKKHLDEVSGNIKKKKTKK